MDYRNTELKLETLVKYFNEERINLNPVFQRGSVWNLKARQELMKNVVLKRPIPAIFVYKDEDGSRYSFNIMDGKQRLESILLFIGHARPDFCISTWAKYIVIGELRDEVNFSVPIGTGKSTLVAHKDLGAEVVRDLREYPIPMIEITLNENTSIDEIISLFVDINQQGVKVTRLQIVRALKRNDPFLKDIYTLVAQRQTRTQAVFVRRKRTDFTYVLKRLQSVASVTNADQQADRMWERLFELALFVRSGKHRKPTEILKSFISSPAVAQERLSATERAKLRNVFDFLSDAYRGSKLDKTRFATDQTHFYTMVTSLLETDLLQRLNHKDIVAAIVKFDEVLGSKSAGIPGLTKLSRSYREVSAKQTSDTTRRGDRGQLFIKALETIVAHETDGLDETES